MKAEVLAKLLAEKGIDVPVDVLASIKASHKADIELVRECQESNLAETRSLLQSIRATVENTLNEAGLLNGTAFAIRGRMVDGMALVTVENAHSTGTKRPIHIGSDGVFCVAPERNKRDYTSDHGE